MKRITLVLALFALVLPTLAQQVEVAKPQPFGEKIDVNAVLLDVIVTDSKGHQILGLGKDDFIVKEDGVPQNIESVDYFTNRRLLDQREENAPFKVERVHEDRYFIFFFDKPDAGALASEINRARQATIDFVKNEMQPTDYVAIVGHDMRLKIYSDFSNNKQQLLSALNDVQKFGKGVVTPPAGNGPSLLRNSEHNLINDTGSVYKGLDYIADASRSIRGRKNLVLFSPGIRDRFENIVAGSLTKRSDDFDEALRSLNASNIAVYGVQLQQEAGITPLIHQRLTELSNETGGNYFMFNTSFEPAVKRIENTNSGYYLVSYSSKKPRGEKGFQKVDVKLKNPEFKVVARNGYEYGG